MEVEGGVIRNACKIAVGKLKGKRPFRNLDVN
jgi:hypothetical protein